jgi:ATP-dependent DNA helicase RecQ
LAKVAELRPRDLGMMERLLGDRRTERFGAAFMTVLDEG